MDVNDIIRAVLAQSAPQAPNAPNVAPYNGMTDGLLSQVGRQTSNLDAAHAEMNLTPQERALYERHLSNLYGPGGVDNPNGSRSTLSQLSFKNLSDGKYYNVPMVYDGTIMAPDDAIDFAKAQGIDQFPSYPDEATAEQRYQQMHSFMEKDTADYFSQRPRN